MTGGESGPGADGIEEGKRLIRVGSDGGLSLAERLTERFYRLTWRTPLHGFRLRGRHPLKLIAVPDDPFRGDIERGHALLDRKLSFRGETRTFDALDLAKPNFSRAFANYLHSFTWLRDLASVAPRAQAAPIAEALMRAWLDAHADHVTEPAWRADLWGRRIQAWTAHAPLILSSTDLVYRSRVLNTLARGARHIDRTADKQAPGTGRVAAWCGVITAGLLIPGGESRRVAGEVGMTRALQASLFEDGGNVARSPAAQVDLLMLLTSLREAYDARRIEPPVAVSAALERMVPVLLGACLGDRALSSWQGGGPDDADRLAEIIAATGIRTRPQRQTREWGYQRLASGAAVAVIDAAPPPVSRLADGGCASTLAFEFSDGEDRLIVNCGGARALRLDLPVDFAEALRTTAAHSTLVIEDTNSTAINADGSLGRGVVQVELARQESEGASRIEASHDGYARRFGFSHRRQLVLTGDGRELRGEDMLLPAGKPRKVAVTPFAIRFHLAPNVRVSPTADGLAALLRLPGGAVWQFRCRGGTLGIEDSVWIDGKGQPRGTQQLVVSGETPAGGASVSWTLKRAN